MIEERRLNGVIDQVQSLLEFAEGSLARAFASRAHARASHCVAEDASGSSSLNTWDGSIQVHQCAFFPGGSLVYACRTAGCVHDGQQRARLDQQEVPRVQVLNNGVAAATAIGRQRFRVHF